MKKIILGLFLMLGVLAFAAPKYVDVNKIQKSGYQLSQDTNEAFIFGKATEEVGITVAYFFTDDKATAKDMSQSIKVTAPNSQKFIESRENKRAYIHKFEDTENKGYTYSFVAKKPKIKNCHISVLYVTDKNFKNNELDKEIDKVLNEVEGFLK